MIPYWRTVRYTDDGCCIYQCLQCKAEWESRTGPGYTDRGVYRAHWHYCPYCGCQWQGTARESEDDFGPRRKRIVEAQYKARWPQREPSYWWVIEERTLWGEDAQPWKAVRRMRGEQVPAARVLEIKRLVEKSRNTLEPEDIDDEPPGFPLRYEYRLVRYRPGDVRLSGSYEMK